MTDMNPKMNAKRIAIFGGLLLVAAVISIVPTTAAHNCYSDNHGGCDGHSCPDDGHAHDHTTSHWYGSVHQCRSTPASGSKALPEIKEIVGPISMPAE